MFDDFSENDKTPAIVEFYDHAVTDREATEREGRRMFRDVLYIKVKNRGFKDYISRPATEQDKDDYPQAFARYLNAQSRKAAGFQLSAFPAASPSILAKLRLLRIETAEQLATAALDNPEEFEPLLTMAKAYVKALEAA